MDFPPWAPTIRSRIVTLRAHADRDIPAVLDHCRDPEMTRWTTVPHPYHPRDARAFVLGRRQAWEAGHCFTFALDARDPTTGRSRYAGAVELRRHGATRGEIGYGLAPWARGRGIGSAAVRLLVTWGFTDTPLQVIHWRAVVGNWSSRRLAWATGFRVEGTVRGLAEGRYGAEDAWIGSLCQGDPLEPAHPWYEAPRISTPHLTLREPCGADAPRVVEAFNDPETLLRFPDLPRPFTTEDHLRGRQEALEASAGGRRLVWTVAGPDDRLLGEVTLFGLDSGDRCAEIGYWVHPQARGRGVAGTAVRAAVRHATIPLGEGGLGLDRIVLRTTPDNHASRGVARTAGFREIGLERGAERLGDGTRRDLVRHDLLAADVVWHHARAAGSTGQGLATPHGHRPDALEGQDTGVTRTRG